MRKSSQGGVMNCKFSGLEKNSNISSIGLGSHCSRCRTYVCIFLRTPCSWPNLGIDTSLGLWQNRRIMLAQWKIKPSALFILSCVIFLMLLIVVLPDVDLPDTAFHRNTGPTAIHAQANAAPMVVAVSAVSEFSGELNAYQPFYEPGALISSPDPNFRPIILRSIRR